MNKKTRLSESSASGLMPVVSVADIPDALLEAEGECSALSKELSAIGKAKPDIEEAVNVLKSRTDIMLNRLTVCRELLTVGR